eukprot:gene8534-9235_t
MTFVAFVTVAICMVVLASAELKFPRIKVSGRGLFSTKKHPKPALRSRVAVRGEESPIIKMYGYFERVLYVNGDCTSPISKSVIAINVCSLSADPDHAGQYNKASVFAYPDWNYYEIDTQYFSDPACTTLSSTETFTLPILICNDNELDHVINYPLSPSDDNLGFSLLLYNSQSNCQTNNYQVGATEAVYAPLNLCLEPDDPSEDVDTMVVSCSSTALVINQYTTNDGTCGGAPNSSTLYANNWCTTSGDDTILDVYYGYSNYGCAANL